MRRWTRCLATLALGMSLTLGTPAGRAFAQQPEEPAAEGGESGRPWDGYIATALFAGLALFLIGKSARR